MTRIQPGLSKVETDRLFTIAGTFFIVIQVLLLSTLVFDPLTRPYLFWLCNNFCLFLAVGCFCKNMQWVKGISYAGLIPQCIWIADFVSSLLGFHMTGITAYISSEGYTYANNISIVLHISVPIVILIFSFRTRPQLVSLLYAIPYIATLFILTYAYTPSALDINCIFSGCNLDEFLPYTVSAWPLYTLTLALCGYGIHRALYYGWGRYHDLTPLNKNTL